MSWPVICPFLHASSPDPSKDELKSLGRELAKELVPSLHFSHIKTLYYLQLLAGGKPQRAVPAREMNKVYSGAAKALPFLLEQGLVCRVEQRVFRNPYGEQLSWFPKPEVLTQEQNQALSHSFPPLRQRNLPPFCSMA